MLLAITILGFLISIVLLINLKESNNSSIYLVLFFLINNIYSLSHYATIYSGNKTFVAIMLVHFSPIYMLSGPALFFYIRGVLNDEHKLKKIDFLHFIPAIIYFINFIFYFFSPFEYKIAFAQRVISNPMELANVEGAFFSGQFNFIIRPLVSIVYSLISAIMIYRFFKKNGSLQKQYELIKTWLIFLITSTLLIYVSFLIFTIVGMKDLNYDTAAQSGRYLLIATIVGLIILDGSLLFFPNILYGLPQLDAPLKRKFISSTFSQDIQVERKSSRGLEISLDKIELLKFKIENYIKNKPYLNSDFSLNTMSIETDIPVHHLSYYFNEELNMGFNNWKNGLKIEYIVELINNGSSAMITLDGLSKQAGFNSRSTFVNAFKQKMGSTPSEYIISLK